MTGNNALPKTIRTARLTLRAPMMDDLADIVAMANNPKMLENTATLPHPYGDGDAMDFVTEARSGQLHAYAIAGADDRFMGTILFKYPQGKPPEIGYWLGEPHWGQGFAGEAVAALVGAVGGIEGFADIEARVLQSNPASIRVLEKAGFSIVEQTLGVMERHRGKPVLVLRWSAR